MSNPDLNSGVFYHMALGRTSLLFAVLLLILIVFLFQSLGCSTGADDPDLSREYRLNGQADDWTALFSNYGVGREDDFELESGYRSLPEAVDTDQQTGFYLSGNNLSDDLNMFLKHRVDGLDPNTEYKVELGVTFATDAPSGCAGVGGAPGESVTVHTTASAIEPERLIDDSRENDYYRLNLAEYYEGDQPSWYRATEIGNVANSRSCEEGWGYEIKELESKARTVTTSNDGSAWLLVGTRSGFEATSSLYYTKIRVQFYEQ